MPGGQIWHACGSGGGHVLLTPYVQTLGAFWLSQVVNATFDAECSALMAKCTGPSGNLTPGFRLRMAGSPPSRFTQSSSLTFLGQSKVDSWPGAISATTLGV